MITPKTIPTEEIEDNNTTNNNNNLINTPSSKEDVERNRKINFVRNTTQNIKNIQSNLIHEPIIKDIVRESNYKNKVIRDTNINPLTNKTKYILVILTYQI